MATELGAAYISILPEVKAIGPAIRSALGDAGPAADKAGSEAGDSFGGGFSVSVGKMLSAAAAAAIGAAFVGGLNSAVEQSQMGAKLQAQLGLSDEGSARAGKIAGELYASNYGDSLGTVNEALGRVMTDIRSTRDATDEALTDITAKVLNTSEVFDQDLGGITRAVSQMMRTGLAKNANEALDIITVGFQKGADKSGDFLDTINEYGTQFRKMGIGGKAATGLIAQGLRAGARDGDLVADSIKEFSIRAIDGSESTGLAFKAIGLDAGQMAAKIGKGGTSAKGGLQQVLDGLRAIKDPVKREAAAVGLFGTQAEDMGQALYALDLGKAAGELGKVGGAAQKAADQMSDTPAAKWETFKRELETGLVGVMTSKVIPAFQSTSTFIQEHKGLVLGLVGAVTLLTAAQAAGSAVMAVQAAGGLAAMVKSMPIVVGLTKVWAAGQWLLNAAMAANPVGLVVLAIAALVAGLVIAYKKSETFRAIVQAVWAWLKTATVATFNAVKNAISVAWNAIKTATQVVWNAIKAAVANSLGAIKAVVGAVLGAVKLYFTTIWNVIKTVTSVVWSGIKLAVTTYINAVKAVVTTVLNAIKSVVTNVWNGIKAATSAVWNGIKTVVQRNVNAARTVVTAVSNGIKKVLTTAWNAIKGAASAAWSAISSVVSGAIGRVKAVISGISAVVGVVKGAFERARAAVADKINAVVSLAKSLPGKITGGLGDLGRLLFDAGKKVIQGLIDGIENMVGALTSKLGSITKLIPLKKGPPSKDAKLLKPAGQLIMKGLIKGLESGKKGLAKKLGAITKYFKLWAKDFDGGSAEINATLSGLSGNIGKLMDKAYPKMPEKFRNKMAKNAISLLKGQYDQIRANGRMQDAVDKKLGESQAKLAAMQEMAGGVRDNLRGELDLGSLAEPQAANDFGFGGGSTSVTFASVQSAVSGLAARARVFAAKITALYKSGMPHGLIQEVAGLGSAKGIAVADAILSGSKSQRAGLTRDWGGMEAATQGAGNAVAESWGKIGVQAQQGLVNGLLSEQAQLDKAAVKLSKKLVKALRKALGIKSPARLVRDEAGVYVGQGMGVGAIKGMDQWQSKVDRRAAQVITRPELPGADSFLTGSAAASGEAALVARMADALSRAQLTAQVAIGNRDATKITQVGMAGQAVYA